MFGGDELRRRALSPGVEHARAALALVDDDPAARRRPEHVAALLAQAQPVHVFVDLVARAGHGAAQTEALACWAHELVVRGVDLSVHDVIVAWWRQQPAHPLAKLPLRPLPHEAQLPSLLRSYGADGGGAAPLPFGPHDRPALPIPHDGAPPLPPLPPDAPFAAAFANWIAESNGHTEACRFVSGSDIERFDQALLGRLQAASLDDARSASIVELDAAGALGTLFSAAANGGAYNSGRGGAYGRLDAWSSLGALAVGRVPADFTALAGEVAHARFFEIESDSSWFHNVAWDLTLACVRRDGRTIAMLAASDQD